MPSPSACCKSGMTREETAPPTESWPEHLKALSDQDLKRFADDYRWLNEENRPEEQRGEFARRREAILQECERRGLSEAADGCRKPDGTSRNRA